MKNKTGKILDETALPHYYDKTDHTFSYANLVQLEKHLINLLSEYSVKEIRSLLTKLNKKAV